jgi:hypothetical protein
MRAAKNAGQNQLIFRVHRKDGLSLYVHRQNAQLLSAVCLTIFLTLIAFYGNILQIKGTGFTSRAPPVCTIVAIKRPILKFLKLFVNLSLNLF